MNRQQPIQILRPRLGALSLIVLLAVTGCGGGGEEPAHYEPKSVPATLTTAQRAVIPWVTTATGTIEAENSIEVSTRLMGHVREVLAREGQRVQAGEVLVRIDDIDMQARKRQAEAGIAEAQAVLDNANTNLERFARLFAEHSVSRAQLDDVRTGRDRAAAGLKQAQAALAEVEVQLSYLSIVAPASGTVTRRLVDPGDMANPGMPLVMLEQNGTMKVRAGLAERDVDLVDVGAEVTVQVTSLANAEFTVPVARILPAANPMSRTFDLEAYLPNQDRRLRSGMFARVKVPVGSREAVMVPTAALHTRGQLTGVWLVDDAQTAHLRWIRVGRELGDEIEVLSGLQGGERVVLHADMPLVEGDKVVN